MNWYKPVNPRESQSNIGLDRSDRAELDNRIRTALGYMKPEKIANYLGLTVDYVNEVKNRTPYRMIRGLRDVVKGGRR